MHACTISNVSQFCTLLNNVCLYTLLLFVHANGQCTLTNNRCKKPASKEMLGAS